MLAGVDPAVPAAVDAISVRRDLELERVQLDATSWVDVGRGWLEGADLLCEELCDSVAWRSSRLFRYDH